MPKEKGKSLKAFSTLKNLQLQLGYQHYLETFSKLVEQVNKTLKTVHKDCAVWTVLDR